MKDNSLRIFALIVMTILIVTGFLVMFPRDLKSDEKEPVDERTYFPPNSPLSRPTRAGTPWPMHLNNPLHTSYTTDDGPITDNYLWYSGTGGTTYGSPAVVNDKAFVGSKDNSLNEDYMNAFYANNGTLAWRTKTYNNVPGGLGVSSSPAYSNGFIYFGGDGIYCLWENNGTVKWFVDTPTQNWGDGTPTVVNGRVYCGGSDRKLYAINQDTGNVDWTFQTLSSPSTNYGLYAPPAISNGYVILAACDGYVYKINENQPTSIASADYSFNSGMSIYSAPVVVNGRVYFGNGYYSFTTTGNRVYCLSEVDLSLIWQFYPGIQTSFFSSAGYLDDKIYIGSIDGNLYCLNATGSGGSTWTHWQYTMGQTWSSPAITKDRLYIGARGGLFYCFNLSQTPGSEDYYWIYNTGDDVDSSPAIVDGKAYVASQVSGGRLYCFGNDTVPPTTDYIQIRDAPSGGGNDLGDPSNFPGYPVGHTTTFYGAEYNSSIGYLGSVRITSTWASLIPSVVDVTSPGASSIITCSDTSWGVVTIILNDGQGHQNSTQVTVIEPTVDYIQIRDAPGGGGNNLCDPLNYPSYPVGHTTTFYSAEYNNTAGYIGDVPSTSTWDCNIPAIVSVSSPGISSTITCSDTAWGTVTITLDDLSENQNTTQVTVSEPTVDYVLIRDASGGLGNNLCDPSNYRSYPVGGFAQYYGAEYNSTAGYIGDVPGLSTWVSSDPSIVSVTSPGGMTNATCSNVNWGAVTITLNDGSGHQNTTQVDVLEPETDYIIISSAPGGIGTWIGDTTYVFSENDTFYAAGYNITAGWVEDVPANWSSDAPLIGNVTSGPSASTNFDAIDNGTCTITATYDIFSNSTGVITITGYTVDYIIIRDSPGGDGAEVGDRIFGVGETTEFYAAAYNTSAPGQYIGDVSVVWSSSNITVANVTTPGISTLFAAQFVGGECNVTAIYSPLIQDVTGTLTVLTAGIDYILITNASDGVELTTVYLDVGKSITLYASSYNSSGPTFLGVVGVDWTQTSSLGQFDPFTGSSTTFTAGMVGGNITITANYTTFGLTDDFTIVINEPTVDYILIRNVPGGGGNVVTTNTYYDLDADFFYAAAYNLTSDYLYDVGVTWTSDNTSVAQVTPVGIWTNFTAQQVEGSGTCSITAIFSPQISASTGLLTVLLITVDYIQIRDAANGLGNIVTTGSYIVYEVDKFYAAAYSNFVDYLFDVEVNWSVNDSHVGQVTYPGIWTNFTAQLVDEVSTCIVTAQYSDLISNSTEELTVIPPSIDFIQILGENHEVITAITLDLEEWVHYYTVGYNHTVGPLGNVIVSWSLGNELATIIPEQDYYTNLTATINGSTILMATFDSAISNSTQITINPRISAPTGLVVTPLPQGKALNISWNRNPEESLAGYNIYRSLLPDSEFRMINTDLITSEYYIDESLVNGIRYYYYVVAVDSSNKLSDPSEKASGVPDIDTDSDGLLNYEDDDDDNDGLSDTEEADIGTDPLNWDSDGDEVNDKDDYYPRNENKWVKEKEEDKGIPLILLLVPIIVIILIPILVILLSKRRKKDEGPPPIASERRELPPPPPSMRKKEKEIAPEDKQTVPSEEGGEEASEDDIPEEELPPPDDEEISEDELPPPDDE
ncbi:MAG: PQQ-binding-like beta-propeller repeat protein [Thermoplasmata archaeon]|nr:MAG: PQQ-binding-like beta-propeller repeat protein [Thermoplasmata archaeon]